MGGGDEQKQEQTQNSVTNPWEPAQAQLKSILGNYANMNTAVTPEQMAAVKALQSSAGGMPSFGAAGTTAVNNLFNSSTAPQVGMLKDSFGRLNANIGGIASGAELDPYKTPGFSDAIGTMTNDITNKLKSVYNASGRDPSGAGSFGKSLGRGLTEGIAPVIQSQFNTNNANRINAAGALYGAGNTTAGAITGQEQIPLTNSVQGMQSAGMLKDLFTGPAMAQLAAAQQGYQMPFANLAQMLAPITQIAGLGGQSTGTSSGTVTQTQSPMSNIMGGISGGIGLLSFLSDARAKEDIEEVGELHDGQRIYSYRYKGQPGTQIGLLAQEVLEHEPEAVSRIPQVGMLAVNYHKATRKAAALKEAA